MKLLMRDSLNFEAGLAEGRAEGLAEGLAEGRAEGLAEGDSRRLIYLICKKLIKGKNLEDISEELEEETDVIRPMYDVAIKHAPDYELETVFQAYINGENE